MPSLRLIPHPTTPVREIESFDVQLARQGNVLEVSYTVVGEIGALTIPAPARPTRRDELWCSTCFELFLQPQSSTGYWELNFSPSQEWAAYEFDDYRVGMRLADVDSAPSIACVRTERKLEVAATCPLPKTLAARLDRIGVSAVLQMNDGSISYWALVHCKDKPDFHARESFILDGRELRATGSTS
ncbi:MAG TPA: DOMON-like domain-containing protein [Steroidobacteraceae bacterium]